MLGFLIGLTYPLELVAETNSRVAAWVSPRLIDLLAALATGVVGAFALVRSDVPTPFRASPSPSRWYHRSQSSG